MTQWTGSEGESVGSRMSMDSMLQETNHYLTNLSSPTTINCFSAPSQPITPYKSPRKRGTDDESIYKLVEDPRDSKSVTSGGMGSTTENSANMEDELCSARSNIDPNFTPREGGVPGSPVKRRRLALVKEFRSPKRSGRITQSGTPSGRTPITVSGAFPLKSKPHLTTPPNSSRRTKSKMNIVTSARELSQTIIFPQHTIRKPMASVDKGHLQEAPSNAINRNIDWTTTEDRVKSQFNGLTKTTLDKMAAFRYTANSSVAKPSILPFPLTDPNHENLAANIYKDDSHGDEAFEPGIAGDCSQSDEIGLINQWSGQYANHEPAELDSTHRIHLPHGVEEEHSLVLEDAFQRKSYSFSPRSVDATVDVTSPRLAQPSFDPSDDRSATGEDHSHIFHTRHSFDEGQVIDDFMEYEDPLRVDKYTAKLMTTKRGDVAMEGWDGHPQAVEGHLRSAPAKKLRTTNTRNLHSEDYEGLPTHSERASSDACREGERHQLETRSPDMHDCNNDGTAVDEGLLASDEFDEGLDDAEFLILVPAPGLQVHLEMQSTTKNSQYAASNSHETLNAATTRTAEFYEDQISERLLEESRDIDDSVLLSIPYPTTAILADEEFPIDDKDEGDMLNFPELFTGVIKSAVVPPSVTYPFADDFDLEIYDSSLKYSPVRSGDSLDTPRKTAGALTDNSAILSSPVRAGTESLSMDDDEDWSFILAGHGDLQIIGSRRDLVKQSYAPNPKFRDHLTPQKLQASQTISISSRRPSPATLIASSVACSLIDDSQDYLPMQPFARPAFPSLAPDRSPIIGVSTSTFLRTCFRIGELFKEGAKCSSQHQDAIVELFARVTFSFRDQGSTTQHFQFADLWHDRPPFSNGVLANYKITKLVDSESRIFLEVGGERKMARVLGRLKRCKKNGSIGWVVHVVNIRETDWEEIRWTRTVVSRGLCKSEEEGLQQ